MRKGSPECDVRGIKHQITENKSSEVVLSSLQWHVRKITLYGESCGLRIRLHHNDRLKTEKFFL